MTIHRNLPAPPITRPVDEPGVLRILAISDPVLRNLWITLAYYDLAVGMARVMGPRDVSWVAFATWASKTAGVSIRGEQLEDLLRNEWRAAVAHQQFLPHLGPHLLGAGRDFDLDAIIRPIFGQAVARMSTLIAEGNRTVFAELGPLFARMIATCQATPLDPAAVESFLETVKAIDGEDSDATSRLRNAFRRYVPNRAVGNAGTTAQEVFLAGGLVGLTEQIRLQSAIEASLNAVVDVGLHELVGKLLGPFLRFPGFVSEAILHPIVTEIESVWRRVVTVFLLRLKTPEAVLDLSRDAPPARENQQFPDDLIRITEPDVVHFLREHDRTNGNGRPSGAGDWANLRDRMNYIINLFRSWQQNAALLRPPFTPEQIAAMQQGRIPEGPL